MWKSLTTARSVIEHIWTEAQWIAVAGPVWVQLKIAAPPTVGGAWIRLAFEILLWTYRAMHQ